jgi:hypothetical protein
MKITVKVIGPSQLKGLMLAEGKTELGEVVTGLLVKQAGPNACLHLHSSNKTMIGEERVIGFKGQTFAEASAQPGATFEVDVFLLCRPAPSDPMESAQQKMAKQDKQIEQLTGLVQGLMTAIGNGPSPVPAPDGSTQNTE